MVADELRPRGGDHPQPEVRQSGALEPREVHVEAPEAGVRGVDVDAQVEVAQVTDRAARVTREELHVVVGNRVAPRIHGPEDELLPLVDRLARRPGATNGFALPLREACGARYPQRTVDHLEQVAG